MNFARKLSGSGNTFLASVANALFAYPPKSPKDGKFASSNVNKSTKKSFADVRIFLIELVTVPTISISPILSDRLSNPNKPVTNSNKP